jgi:hypothetical protein
MLSFMANIEFSVAACMFPNSTNIKINILKNLIEISNPTKLKILLAAFGINT